MIFSTTSSDRLTSMRILTTLTLLWVVGSLSIRAQDTPSAAPAPAATLTPPADNAPAAPDAATTSSALTPTPNPPKAQAAPLTSREVARIQQQEIIRRQELIFKANEAMKDANKAELATNYAEARKSYLFAAEAYGSVSHSSQGYLAAAQGIARVDAQLYDGALKAGDMARAKQLVDEIVKYNPQDQAALEKQMAINRALANPNDTSLLGNPAITPGFVKQVNEVQKLFVEAEQFRRTGQYDEAQARLKRILGIDSYNVAATKELERITAEKYRYDETARLETRTERLRQVEEKWYPEITNKDVTVSAQETQPSLTRATNFDIDQKLRGIMISLSFNNASIEEATNFLSIESKRLDPDHKGISFIILPEAAASAKPVTLALSNVPLGEALRYVCQIADEKYKVQDYAISIVPVTQNTEDLLSRTFIVPPSFVAPPSSAGADTGTDLPGARRPIAPAAGATAATADTSGDTTQSALEAKHVKFPAGSSAVYSPNTGQLTVVNTADQMELIEELVNAGQAPTLMVRISTKFVEINQQDVNDLTFNSSFSFLNANIHTGSKVTDTTKIDSASYNTALPGASGFTANGIDQLLNPSANYTNSFYFRGNILPSQFAAVIQALSQKKSYDLLSEPSALTKSGEQATMEAIRIFPYPVSFDPPELVTQTNNSTSSITVEAPSPPTVIPTTPTEFKRRNIGVRLVIKPQVTADNKTVDLSLFPEVTDFEGFINYGTAINVGNPDGTSSLLSPNEINQPVFNTRRINTKVLIRDGSTVVLGGLIREDLQNINDKVPILGDIPLIGRLFQSKATTSTKRNLIVFVTANIYRNDGELLNPPEISDAAGVLLGHNAPVTPAASGM